MRESKHIAYRTCVGCRQRRPKQELVRYVADSAGELMMDAEQVRPGRGCYVCHNEECLTDALKKYAFARTFHAPVRVDTERLKAELTLWLITKK